MCKRGRKLSRRRKFVADIIKKSEIPVINVTIIQNSNKDNLVEVKEKNYDSSVVIFVDKTPKILSKL